MRYVRGLALQEMCLQVVVENLDKYIYNKNQFTPQRHIDFLLRMYSKECFVKYTESHSKTEECLLWFLSSHNKTVFLSSITENIMRKLQIVGPVITSLTLAEAIITENMLNAIISVVPHVSYLDLTQTDCSDQTLLCIGRMCPELVTLNLEDCRHISDRGISNLCDNTLPLKNVNILDTHVYFDGVFELLTQMPSLECINYDNIADVIFELYDADMEYGFDEDIKFNLTKLTYDDSKLNDPLEVIRTCTILCPNVEEFHLLFPVSKKVLELFSRFSHLKNLELFQKNSYALTPFLPLANNLTTLILHGSEIPCTTLIECFKNLKKLSLEKVTFTDFREEEIKLKCTNLDTLRIIRLDLSNATTYKSIVLLISLSNNVTRLAVDYIQYFPAGLMDTILNSMTKLSFVRFSCVIADLPSSVLRFFEFPSMKQVTLDDSRDPFFGTPLQPYSHADHVCNNLSWRIMNNDEDEFDEEFQ